MTAALSGAGRRNKGLSGEREIAALIRELTGWDVKRRVRQHEGDSDLEGIPGWSVEVKRQASASRADVARWWKQAAAQSVKGELEPVLFYRVDRGEWRAVWPVGSVAMNAIKRGSNWRDFELAAETSVWAWALVATLP